MFARRWINTCRVLALWSILMACPLMAKPDKKTKGGGKAGEFKAKLLAEEGASSLQKQDLATAMEKYRLAVETDPGYSDYHTQLATVLRAGGRREDAMKEYEAAISMMNEPRNKAGGDRYWAAVHINLGYVYAEGGGGGLFEGAMGKAADAFKKATTFAPDMAEAYTYWGNAMQEMGRWEEAKEVFTNAIMKLGRKVPPETKANYHFHLANCWGQLGDSDKALAAYMDSTEANPKFAAAYTNMGTIYQGRKLNEKASMHGITASSLSRLIYREALEHAVLLDGQLAEAYTNLGIALQDLGMGEQAVAMTAKAVELKPTLAAAYNNHGRALEHEERLDDALAAYKSAMAANGQPYPEAFCAKVYLEHFLCEWDELEQDMKTVAVFLKDNLQPDKLSSEPCVQPFRAFAYPLPPPLFLNVTVKVVDQERARLPPKSIFKLRSSPRSPFDASAARQLDPTTKRLRVGYLSSDFGGHTVGSLIRNLLKMHNRHRVEIVGIGMMKGDGTEWNMEMQASTDKWLSIYEMNDHAAAFAVDSCEVHILIDLNGHSKGARVGVLLRRPAPILMTYLGYPSSSGKLDDLLVADSVVLPPETSALYTEKVIHLPNSYFVNDHRQLYPRPFEHEPTRQAHDLPEGRVLLGNFGQLYKVEPKLFDVWSSIVKATNNSSLWLLKFPQDAVKGLRRYAKKRKLKPEQMHLSSLLPIDSHLAIKSLADMALDTVVFNGHTTGADTLWAAVPLITLSGEQMRSRAGASMARALGCSTWVARTLTDYKDIAIRLASNRKRLHAAKRELERRVEESPFFDTQLWAKGFERSWFQIWDTFEATGAAASMHIVTAPSNLEQYGLDWTPENIMIGTTRHKRSKGEKGGGGGPVHDPLKLSKG